jgi:hypothetical protein
MLCEVCHYVKKPQESLEQLENKGSKLGTTISFSISLTHDHPSLEGQTQYCHSSTNLIIFHTIHDFYRFYRFPLSIGFAQKSFRNPTSWLFYHYDFCFYSGAIWRNRDERLCLLICISLWEIFLVAIFHHWFALLQHPTFFSQGERSYRYIALHSLALFLFYCHLVSFFPFRYPSFPIITLLDSMSLFQLWLHHICLDFVTCRHTMYNGAAGKQGWYDSM